MEELGRALTPRKNPHRARSQVVFGRSSAKMRCSHEGLALRRVCRAHSYPAVSLSHRFARSPVYALIKLKVRCRLHRLIPIGLHVHRLICVLSVMKAIRRICPPHSGHSNGKHFAGAGDQHRPQVMRRWTFGWTRIAKRHHARYALAHVGWPGLHHDLLGQLCRCRQRHRCSPERRVRGQHTKIAEPIGARR